MHAAHATNYLTYTWSCRTRDPNPDTVCKESMEGDPRVADSGTQLVVMENDFSPKFAYSFTVVVQDTRMKVGREPVNYTQTIKVAEDPIPVVSIICEKNCDSRYVHPGDRWILQGQCDSCIAYPVPVFYRWNITRVGGPPDEFNWANSTEAGTNEGKGLETIAILPNILTPGAEYNVELLAKYQPETKEDYDSLRALAESHRH